MTTIGVFLWVCHCFAETVITFGPDRENSFSGVRAQSENQGQSLMTLTEGFSGFFFKSQTSNVFLE